jgi:hypothetical protein
VRKALLILALAACHRGGKAAPDGGAPHPDAILLPSAADPSDGTWARGCARLMARQIDQAAGRDVALTALVVAATPRRVGWALPSAPIAIDHALAAAKRYGARRFVRVHIYGPDPTVRNILMDVVDVDGLKTIHSRAYPWNPHKDMPPLRSATIDLSGALGLSTDPTRVLEGAPFVETQNAQALEAFLGGLDNLTLAAMARGRPLGPGYRLPKELFDEAATADPAFQTARQLSAAGASARFDRVLVSEIALKE